MKNTIRKLSAGFCVAIMLMSLAACGGGGGGSTSTASAASAAAQNVQAVSVDAGPANTVNALFTSVTICAPANPANCQTIDHVLVDTGSVGLRIISSVLSASVVLPQQIDVGGKSIIECTQFVDGYSWGPVKTANVKLGGESANALPIQVIGDPAFATVPAACSSSGPAENTVQAFGANGVLGIGFFLQDCGPACAQNAAAGVYYACASSSACQPALVSQAQQVPNPVSRFVTDNNGVMISLPSVPDAGLPGVTGSLLFGIGTQANNALGSAKVFAVDANTGNFTTVFNSRSYTESFIDSGSNGIFFPDGATPACGSGFYCPAVTQRLSAVNQSTNGANATSNFGVANADSMLASNNGTFTAFSLLGGPNPNTNSFDWGLPFFFGRNVFVAIEGKNTNGGGVGPYVAY